MDQMEREKTSTGKSRQETKYWRRRETLLNAGVSWCSVVHEAVAYCFSSPLRAQMLELYINFTNFRDEIISYQKCA